MRLSDIEFRAMNTWWRRWAQKNYELPLFRHLGLDVRDKDVLEIGCGSGYGAHLIDKMSPHSYIGLDAMEEQIDLARRNYPQFRFLLQDATDLGQIGEASKDIVVVFGVLHHIPEWRKVIDEITRVLKPGSSLFLEEPRGNDLRLFDYFFHWGHPLSDFSLRSLEIHLEARKLTIVRKQWTPLLTLYHTRK